MRSSPATLSPVSLGWAVRGGRWGRCNSSRASRRRYRCRPSPGESEECQDVICLHLDVVIYVCCTDGLEVRSICVAGPTRQRRVLLSGSRCGTITEDVGPLFDCLVIVDIAQGSVSEETDQKEKLTCLENLLSSMPDLHSGSSPSIPRISRANLITLL